MKELLQEVNTSCKDCIFATWEEETQVGCDLGKIALYKERKTPIIEAFDDEDREFFVIKNLLGNYTINKRCSGKNRVFKICIR